MGWVGIRRGWDIAGGVARANIFVSGVEVGGAYLGEGGGCTNLLLMACAWRAQALVGQWEFGHSWRLDRIGLCLYCSVWRRFCVRWFALRSEWVIAKQSAEGVARARICLSGVEDGDVYSDGSGGCANFLLNGLCLAA